jgi:TatD DNase family protein
MTASLSIAKPALFDSHCHLDYIERQEGEMFDAEKAKGVLFDATSVLERAQEEGVSFLLNPSVTPSRFPEVIGMAEKFENVYAAVAVHPTDVKDVLDTPQWVQQIEDCLKHPKVIAIGETGLDYYWDTSLKDFQQECFKTFLNLGVKHKLPVIVHDRDAHEDVHQLIQSTPGVFGVMHCFSGDAAFAQSMIDLGFFISFAGNLTYKKATQLHEAAQHTPLEWILIETDSPFLSPVPFRGKPNEPGRVRYVAEKIAELKGITYEEVARVTFENAKRAFQLC